MNPEELGRAVTKAKYVHATVEGIKVRLVKCDLKTEIKYVTAESIPATVQGNNLFIGKE